MPLPSLATLAVALAGGLLFFALRLPIPWLLGPLTGVMLLSVSRPAAVRWPVGYRNTGLVILGYLMGRPFTPEVGRQIMAQLPAMLTMTGAVVLFSLIIGYITHRRTGITLATSVLATVPGGLSQMVVLGEEIAGADVAVITFMQTIRMLSAVFCVPFITMNGLGLDAQPVAAAATDQGAAPLFLLAVILGAWLAVRINMPVPYMLGPTLITAGLVLSGWPAPVLPSAVLIAAQVCVGAFMGTNLNADSLRACRRLLGHTILNAAAIVLFSLLAGFLLAEYSQVSLATAFLAAAPGGIAEMGLTALLLGADVTVVLAYQMFRLLFILLVLPLFLRWWLGPARAGPDCS
jgi:membrane AbrB-like protein